MVSYHIDIEYSTPPADDIDVDENDLLTCTDVRPLKQEERERSLRMIRSVIGFLKSNGGTRFEITEIP